MFAALAVSPSPPLLLSPLKKKNNLYIHTPGESPKRKHWKEKEKNKIHMPVVAHVVYMF